VCRKASNNSSAHFQQAASSCLRSHGLDSVAVSGRIPFADWPITKGATFESRMTRIGLRPRRGITLEPTSLEELRQHVQQVICDQGQLLPGAFDFDEQVLRRHGQPCGLHFSLSGPRSVRFSAIWDAIRHTILFYDCTGERFQRTDLPRPSSLHFELAEFVGSGDTSGEEATCLSTH
jgi:hypothetical protein